MVHVEGTAGGTCTSCLLSIIAGSSQPLERRSDAVHCFPHMPGPSLTSFLFTLIFVAYSVVFRGSGAWFSQFRLFLIFYSIFCVLHLFLFHISLLSFNLYSFISFYQQFLCLGFPLPPLRLAFISPDIGVNGRVIYTQTVGQQLIRHRKFLSSHWERK
jgi:hypothetical protein